MSEYEARKVILKDQMGRYVVPWTGAITSINGATPDSAGNIVIDPGVTSVNGHTGAVTADQLGCLLLSGGTVTGQITAQGGVVGNLSGLATQATQDSAGQQINSTYIKNATVSGRVVTFTRGNGSTFTITTQDTVGTAGATVTKTYVNGNTGYRIWSDGFKEQWGRSLISGESRYNTITFPKAFSNTNYNVQTAAYAITDRHAAIGTKSTTTVQLSAWNNENDWYAFGY